MNGPLSDRAKRIVERAEPTLNDLESLRADLLDELLPNGTPLGLAELGNGPLERLLVDVLTSMSLVDHTDPAHPWTLAAALSAMGRSYEAAWAFLEAEARFRSRSTTDPFTHDEDDWAQSCLEHAADCFRDAGCELSAALLDRLQPES